MAQDKASATQIRVDRRGRHYRELLRQTLVRQLMLYFVPLVLLAVFFHIQYTRSLIDSRRVELTVIAEHQANTLDLFLRERLTNLDNVIDDPQFRDHSESLPHLKEALRRLQQTSPAFVDLGVVDANGDLVAYHGPVQFSHGTNYAQEPWFAELTAHKSDAVITDIYLGLRGAPHFTLAVVRRPESGTTILRAALSPEVLNDYLATLEGASEVRAAVVDAAGVFQVVTARVGLPRQTSPYRPPHAVRRGYVPEAEGAPAGYAYAWLLQTPWALIVEDAGELPAGLVTSLPGHLSWITFGFFLLMGLVIIVRARQLVGRQLATEEYEAELSGQLAQAAKLASVGELAAGIAHEINNPLAIIAEEVGLLQDSLDPELAQDDPPLHLPEHLQIIHDAVFRCRDITRKLLTFVRQTEIKLERHHIHRILDEVVDGMLLNEISIGNIKVVRHYDEEVHDFVTDRNQLLQVFVNLVKNAVDAMPGGGTLTLQTQDRADRVVVTVNDSGVGMTPAQLEKIFLPFFTTKDPGKGTGLGLSVSASIIKNFGGRMYAESTLHEGSRFTVELPYAFNT